MHLNSADVVTTVNQCEVRNAADWLGCMTQLPGVGDHSNLSDFDAASSLTANQLLEIMGQPAVQPGGSRLPFPPSSKGSGSKCLLVHQRSYGSVLHSAVTGEGRSRRLLVHSQQLIIWSPTCSQPHRHCKAAVVMAQVAATASRKTCRLTARPASPAASARPASSASTRHGSEAGSWRTGGRQTSRRKFERWPTVAVSPATGAAGNS